MVELPLLEGIEYAAKLVPGKSTAAAIVEVLKKARLLLRAVSDPAYLVELIPEPARSQTVEFKPGGFLAVKASYSIQQPEAPSESDRSSVIAVFGDLSDLIERVENTEKSGLPSMADVVTAASTRTSPKPLNGKALEFDARSGNRIECTLADDFLPLRDQLDQSLELARKVSRGSGEFDPDRALIGHIKEMAGAHGGRATLAGDELVSADGRVTLELVGESGPVAVRVPGIAGTVYDGTVPLGRTRKVTLAQGKLVLKAEPELANGKLVCRVTGKFTPTGGEPRELGQLGSTTLLELSQSNFVPNPETGLIAAWRVRYDQDGKRDFFGEYTSFGTVKFLSPGSSVASVSSGSQLAEIRELIGQLAPFSKAVFDYESSPYVLGLKVWALLRGDQKLSKQVRQIRDDGRAVAVALRDPARGQDRTLRIVLEDISYYLSASSGGASGDELRLLGETPLQNFRVEGDRVLAQPFTVQLAGDRTPVNDLIVFDGGPKTRSLIARSQAQQTALLQTDLQQFEALGLSVEGEPLLVRGLRVELDGSSVRAVLRPGRLSFKLGLDLGIAGLNLESDGKVKTDGSFKFTGDAAMKLLGDTVKSAKFKLSSDDGFSIEGDWAYLFFDGLAFEGRITPRGRVTGHCNADYMFKGTGLDAAVAVDSDSGGASTKGKIKFFGTAVYKGDIDLNRRGFKYSTTLGDDDAGVSVDLEFKAGDSLKDLKITGSVSAYLDTTLFGTLEVTETVKIGLDGTLEFDVDLELVKFIVGVNLLEGSFDLDYEVF